MEINIYAGQVNIFDSCDPPLEHLTKCVQGHCPLGDQYCCYECDARHICPDVCDDDKCRHQRIEERIFNGR